MKTVTVARRDAWVQPGEWYYFAVYDFGRQTLIARLFKNRKSLDWFCQRRVKHSPIHWGRVKFK